MEHDPIYTVTVRGRDFSLTRSQVEFDGPNYFTACFLGEFKEASTRHLVLARDPDLFFIICDYLCGYQVLPLSNRVIPARMTADIALQNLKADAGFYLLGGLVEQIDALTLSSIPEKVPEKPQKSYLVIGCECERNSVGILGEDELPGVMILEQTLRAELVKGATGGPTWSTPVTEARLHEEPFVNMVRPEALKGYQALRTIAAIESFARMVRDEEPDLVGWVTVVDPSRSQMMVVLAI